MRGATWGIAVVSLGVQTLTACASRQKGVSDETRTEIRREIVAVPVSSAAGEIGFNDFARVIPRIRMLRAEPPRLELPVGQRVALDALRIIALDSAGQALGRLRLFNHALNSPAAELEVGNTVRAVAPGEGVLRIEVALYAQYGGTGVAPHVDIPIIVRR